MNQDRLDSAKRLCSLSSDELFYYGITRVGELTNLDVIGVPVWSAFRPMGHQISVTAGKSLDSDLARAAAIAEAIELSMMEKRQPVNPTQSLWGERVNYPTAKGVDFTHGVIVDLEEIFDYKTGVNVPYPSDLIWLDYRKNTVFQRSSTGQALGTSEADAILGGLYECIERDAMTLRYRLEEKYGMTPLLVDLRGATSPIKTLICQLEGAHLQVFVFHCNLDIPVPVYCAVIVDPAGEFIETMGYGTNLDHGVAIEKAILEAIQARAVYISGARDDMSSRRFEAALARDQRIVQKALSRLTGQYKPNFTPLNFRRPGIELEEVIRVMGRWSDFIMVKLVFGEWVCAKVIVHGLETPITKAWHPNEVRWDSLVHWYERNTGLHWPDIVRSQPRVAA